MATEMAIEKDWATGRTITGIVLEPEHRVVIYLDDGSRLVAYDPVMFRHEGYEEPDA